MNVLTLSDSGSYSSFFFIQSHHPVALHITPLGTIIWPLRIICLIWHLQGNFYLDMWLIHHFYFFFEYLGFRHMGFLIHDESNHHHSDFLEKKNSYTFTHIYFLSFIQEKNMKSLLPKQLMFSVRNQFCLIYSLREFYFHFLGYLPGSMKELERKYPSIHSFPFAKTQLNMK